MNPKPFSRKAAKAQRKRNKKGDLEPQINTDKMPSSPPLEERIEVVRRGLGFFLYSGFLCAIPLWV